MVVLASNENYGAVDANYDSETVAEDNLGIVVAGGGGDDGCADEHYPGKKTNLWALVDEPIDDNYNYDYEDVMEQLWRHEKSEAHLKNSSSSNTILHSRDQPGKPETPSLANKLAETAQAAASLSPGHQCSDESRDARRLLLRVLPRNLNAGAVVFVESGLLAGLVVPRAAAS
ncbi:hypothetical protein HK100_003242 [Physocladia obscura]|uniref:Uncharacterized protein n=1 Tax=Physocladia obscura TaxID=109957 RepID=A0AAD5TFQ6_9FUNG|nr:hypothetical protein HK100_003242 [Physocladia obscura]